MPKQDDDRTSRVINVPNVGMDTERRQPKPEGHRRRNDPDPVIPWYLGGAVGRFLGGVGHVPCIAPLIEEFKHLYSQAERTPYCWPTQQMNQRLGEGAAMFGNPAVHLNGRSPK